MKILSINPFHLKPQVKRLFHRPQQVEIPIAELSEELCKKLAPIQNSLNYMATHYGINFIFSQYAQDNNKLHIDCYSERHFSEGSCTVDGKDDEAGIARKIYEAASKVL